MRTSRLFQHVGSLRLLKIVGLVSMGAMAFSAIAFSTAGAQSLFSIPDTTPNYDSYRYIDDCMSAVERISAEIRVQQHVWRDTLPDDPAYDNRPLPQKAVEMGKRCMAHIDVDTLSLDHPDIWAAGLLMANRDEDAQRLYARYFDSLPKSKWAEAFIGMYQVFERAHPRRYTILKALYNRGIEQVPRDSLQWAIFLRTMIARDAMLEADTVFAHRVVDEALALNKKIPASRKSQGTYKLAGAALYYTIRMVYPSRELDSLKVSSMALRHYLANLLVQCVDDSSMLAFEPAGIVAPPLVGDYWFRANDASGHSNSAATDTALTATYHTISPAVRPVPNRVNVIAFLQGGCDAETPNVIQTGRNNGQAGCWGTIAALHRLKERYPDLALTIVSNTYGSLGNAPPLEPAQEADTLAKYFLGFHHLAATEVVVKTPYIRLPGLDQRRIDEPTQNEKNYTFYGRSWARHFTVLAVDRTGHIFFGGGIGSGINTEEHLSKEIAAVYSRAK